MNYEEAMESTVSKAQAKREIELHDCDGWAVFVAEVGEKDSYTGAEVLGWLGY